MFEKDERVISEAHGSVHASTSLVPRLPSPGNEKRAKTEGSLVEFKARAPLPLLRLSGRARIKDRSGPHQRSRRANFDAGPATKTE